MLSTIPATTDRKCKCDLWFSTECFCRKKNKYRVSARIDTGNYRAAVTAEDNVLQTFLGVWNLCYQPLYTQWLPALFGREKRRKKTPSPKKNDRSGQGTGKRWGITSYHYVAVNALSWGPRITVGSVLSVLLGSSTNQGSLLRSEKEGGPRPFQFCDANPTILL